MLVRQECKNLFAIIFIFILNEVGCICRDSHVVICDHLEDIKLNGTRYWPYVQIGNEHIDEPPKHILTGDIAFNLSRTKSLTIINLLKLITPPFTLTDHIQLTYLNLYSNNITEIEDYTFQGLRKTLKDIYLKNNNIRHLGRAIFQNTNLEIADLSRNRIETITSCFYESKIRWIRFNHNEIHFIKSRSFPQNLELLELNYNHLESLNGNVFINLQNLRELFIESNRLTTIPDFSSLSKIGYLHMANNYITTVNYRFDRHPTLEFLDLSSNLISKVTIDVFSSNETPPLILLPFNRLSNINFNHPQMKTDLVLYGNPWNCDCWLNIEKIMQENKHQKTCQVHYFEKGDIPFCIENGKCAYEDVPKEDVDRFLERVQVCEDKIKTLCSFRL